MDPQSPDPRFFSLTSHFLACRWRFPLLASSACFCPSLNSRMLLGFAYWKHKSYAREGRQSRINKSLKRPPFFLTLGLFAMFYFSQDTSILSLWICELFFLNHIKLSVFLILFFFSFLLSELYSLVLFYSHFLYVSVSRSTIISSLSLFFYYLSVRENISTDSNDDINRLYLDPWSITMSFCSIALSKPPLYLLFTTTLWSCIHYPVFSAPLIIAEVLLPFSPITQRLHFVIRSFTTSCMCCIP